MRPSLLITCSIIAMPLSAPALAQTAQPRPALPALPAPTASDGDDFHGPDADLVVTAPFVRSLDLFGSIGVLEGDDLARDLRGQIGDTLARQAGVSATSFSPGASRPVLRGFQGERVRVLTDGLGSLDASNTSADHAVAIDPLTAERIEIIRGPASLLFGSSAIGGAVNVFDRRIPRAVPESPFHLDALASYGSAADQRNAGASVDLPLTSQLVFHVDGNYLKTNDVRIGGLQLAPSLRADVLAEAAIERSAGRIANANQLTAFTNQNDLVPNTASRTISFGSGLALITGGSSLGISIGYFDTDYGVPERPSLGAVPVTIGLEQWRADLRGEVQLGDGLFDRLRIRAGFSDYQHTEFEGDEIGTVFLNQGLESRAELVQSDRSGWSGASGVQYFYRDFNAIGAEAFIPQNDSEQFALFTLQEIQTGALSFEVSGRYERSTVSANSIGFSRGFNALSGAVGASYEFGNNSKVGVNFARTSRAPSAEELLSDGPHIATASFERGNPGFAIERAWSAEAFVKLRKGPANLTVTAFASWFDNFIHAADTGLIEDDLPLFQYRQSDARYYGLELTGDATLAQFGDYSLSANLTADLVRARIGLVGANGGGNVPRIPPMRVRGGLDLSSDTLTLSGEVEWIDRQNRLAAFETPTAGFTMVNLTAQWKPLGRDGGVTLILSGNNLFDVLGRRHASFTKDFVPLSGRDIRVTARFSF